MPASVPAELTHHGVLLSPELFEAPFDQPTYRALYHLAPARCPACNGRRCPECSHTGQAEFCGADVFLQLAQGKEQH